MALKISIHVVFCVLFIFILNGDKKKFETTIEFETTTSQLTEDREKLSEVIDQINLSAIRNDVAKKFPSVDRELISKIYLKSKSEVFEKKKDDRMIHSSTHLYLVIYMTSKVKRQSEILAYAEKLTRKQLTDLNIKFLP